jgi:mRNA interferase RelE/StbE
MKIEYSRQFAKAAYKLTGKYKESLKKIIIDVNRAENINDVSGCTKLVSFRNSYRIKMGDYRLIILVEIKENIAVFEMLVSRGEIYNKQNEQLLRKKDKK